MGDRSQAIDARENFSVEVTGHPAISFRVSGATLIWNDSTTVFSGQGALCERAEDNLSKAQALTRRQNRVFNFSAKHRVARLIRNGSIAAVSVGERAGLLDLFRRPHRHAPVQNLALTNQVLVGAHGFFHGDIGICAMTLMEVEVRRLQPAKRALNALEYVFARQSSVIGMLGDREEGFAGQDDLVARQTLKAFAQRSLCFTLRVDVRSVEEVDAEIEGATYELVGLGEVDSRAEGEPGPQGDFADLKAAATQCTCSHESESSRLSGQHLSRFAVDFAAVLHLTRMTSTDWLPRVREHLDEVLLDHAHCEKKAAGAAIKLLFSYPHHRFLQEPLAELARDELDHFQQILALLDQRGVRYESLRPSPYGIALHGLVRREEPDRLMDLLLISALIEARSCERFQILADGLEEKELAQLYQSLLVSEARHHGVYVELASQLCERESVDDRLRELAMAEAEIISKPCDWVRLHAG